ncbi:MAG: NUDIX hydrolase [Phycisphaerae bacterium]
MSRSRIRVRRGVIGILSRRGRYLFIRRATGIAKAGCWCFPGGHLEPGENSRVAVQRELREELGIQVTALKRLGAVRVTESRHVLAVWRVAHTAGVLRPAKREIADLRWLLPHELQAMEPGLPSTAAVVKMLTS